MIERKLRIHTLAKEIGVDSKVIIEKCRAEEIDVKNHMHVVGPGLEACIREWFSSGEHATTVEETARVDLETVRAMSRKRKLTKSELAEAARAAAAARVASEAETAIAARGTPETPPSVVAGPQNIPEPAKLKGPRIVRIERPDGSVYYPPDTAAGPPRVSPADSDLANNPPSQPKSASVALDTNLAAQSAAPTLPEQLPVIAEAQTDVAAQIVDSERPTHEILLETQQKQIATLEERIHGLEQKVGSLESAMLASRSLPAAFRELQMKTELAINRKSTPKAHAWMIKSAEELEAAVRERHFTISSATAHATWSALIDKPIVVFEGVPGTGKSQLARLVCDVVLGREKAYGFVGMHEGVSFDDFIGGRRLLDGQIGPTCGCLTGAVLQYHEMAQYWLILDEINRADISALLEPLLDGLANPGGTLTHPYMFPDRHNEAATIPIPADFRIIGTMNPLDQKVFGFSTALKRRIRFVPIRPLSSEAERQLLARMVIDPWKAEVNPTPALADSVGQIADSLVDIAGRLRELAETGPQMQYAPCEIGTAIVIAGLKAGIFQLTTSGAINEQAQIKAIDEALEKEFCNQLEGGGTAALQKVLPIVKDKYPITTKRLQTILNSRSSY